MKKLNVISGSGLVGIFLLSGCGSPSAKNVLEDSIEVIEQAESYNEEIENSVESDSETLNISYKEAVTFEPYARSRTDFNIDGESNLLGASYVDETLYLEAYENSWVEWDEEMEAIDPIYASLKMNPKESTEAALNLNVLNQMLEREEAVEMTEEEEQYILRLHLDSEEEYSDELLASLTNRSAFGGIINAIEADDNLTFAGLDLSVRIDKEANTLDYQEVIVSSEQAEMADPDKSVTETIKVTYDQYNDVSPIELPEEVLSLPEEALSEEEPTNYVDIEEEGENADLTNMPGVLATGEGSSEGAEDLFISIPPIYENSEYASTLAGMDVHIPAINSLSPNNAAMMIWSSVATKEGDNWSAWFVIVNRMGTDIKNIDTTFSFENEFGETLVEDMTMSFDEEAYGVLKNGGILPFLVSIPPESQQAFDDVLTYVHAWPVVDVFEFEEVE